jgi:Tol biopolymer transport system component
VIALLAACDTIYDVVVESEPTPVEVALIAPNGTVSHKQTPFKEQFRYSYWDQSEVYLVRTSPDGYEAHKSTLNVTDAGALPTVRGELRSLRLKLTPAPSKNITQVLVVWDRQQGKFVGVRRKVRAYRDTREATGRIVTRVKELPQGCGIRGVAISPTGDYLVYAEAAIKKTNEEASPVEASATRGGPQSNNIVDLVSCNLKALSLGVVGGGVAQITADQHKDIDPCYTADGKHLLFASNRRRSNRADILRRLSVARKGGIQDIYTDDRDFTALKPTQGKDGTIAFALHPNNILKREEIWTVEGPNQYPTRICEGSLPQISPSGKQIAYIGIDGNLWVVNSDGTQPTQLTTRFADIRDKIDATKERPMTAAELQRLLPYSYPSWSPDGKTILYVSMRGHDEKGRPNEDIWAIAADGGQPEQLTFNGSVDTFPVMSPDGKHVYFLSNRGQRWAIWRMARN